MEGWVKIYREIENHWIWQNDKYFKCWQWFIFRANHCQNKVLLGTEFMDVNRGEFITSISKICQATGMSMQSTRTFLALLEKDKMINKQTTSKLTKITICNYDYYQGDQQTNNKQINKRVTQSQQTDNKPVTTDKNEKNDIKNEKNLKKEPCDFDFSFVEETWKPLFFEWLAYKKSRKEYYKTQQSIEACYRNLKMLSRNDILIGRKVLDKSMGNNYQGLFPIEDKPQQSASEPKMSTKYIRNGQ